MWGLLLDDGGLEMDQKRAKKDPSPLLRTLLEDDRMRRGEGRRKKKN